MPSYVMRSAPRAITPDCGPVIVEVTVPPFATTSMVSKPPAPPSAIPLIEPDA